MCRQWSLRSFAYCGDWRCGRYTADVVSIVYRARLQASSDAVGFTWHVQVVRSSFESRHLPSYKEAQIKLVFIKFQRLSSSSFSRSNAIRPSNQTVREPGTRVHHADREFCWGSNDQTRSPNARFHTLPQTSANPLVC